MQNLVSTKLGQGQPVTKPKRKPIVKSFWLIYGKAKPMMLWLISKPRFWFVTKSSLKNCSPICGNIPLKSSTMKNVNLPAKLSVLVEWKKALIKPLAIVKNARA